MAPFTYTPLKNPTEEIRLFELFPGRGPLRGRLSCHGLEAVKGTYYPLSYCWGKQTKAIGIILNDCAWPIGENLYAALKSIRRQEGRLTMWVDALCISQNSAEEKNAQVSMMGEIFLNGRRTYVWLGPDDIWTRLAFKEITLYAKWARAHGKGGEIGRQQWRLHGIKDIDMGLAGRVVMKLDFLDITTESTFDRSWFTRGWVVQEIAASTEATVICGKHQIDWSDLECLPPTVSQYGLRTLKSIRKQFQAYDTIRLETLLWDTSLFETTDARDRIYSVLGLVGQGSETASHDARRGCEIRVDYNTDAPDVFVKATMHCLMRTRSTWILSASIGVRETENGDFPTWVFNPEPGDSDLSRDRILSSAPDDTASQVRTSGWNTTGGSVCDPRLDMHNRLLGLQGIVVDAVGLVGAQRGGCGRGDGLNGLAEYAKGLSDSIKCYFQWRALSGVGVEKFYRGTTKTTEQAFLEIMSPRKPTIEKGDPLAAERHWNLSRKFDQFLTSNFGFMANQKIHGNIRKRELARIVSKSTRAMFEATFGDREDVVAAAVFEVNGSKYSAKRRFLKTNNGYMGLGGYGVLVGDQVVLFAGSSVPFLIRPSSKGRYRLVGEAYFVGIMDGELWDSRRCAMIWLE